MADLQVTVGADISAYKAGMQDAAATATTASNNISKSLAQAANETDRLGGAAMSSSMRFYTMRSGVSAARDGVMAFTLGGQAAERSLMAMGHHITSLVNETGSFKGAMAALGSSLLGPWGIILGLTLAMELISKFSKAQDDAAKTGEDYINSLDGVNAAMLRGKEAGDNEITRLKILYAATQNHTLSLKSRNQAYDELEKKYPQYFTDAEREKTLVGQNAILYQELTKQIMAAAYAKAYEDQISKNANTIDETQNKRYNLEGQKAQIKDEMKALREKYSGLSDDTFNKLYGDNLLVSLHKIAAIDEQINALKQNEANINKQNLELSNKALNAETTAKFKTEGELGKKDKAKEAATGYDLLKQKVKEAKSALDDAAADNKPQAFIDKLALAYEKLNYQLSLVDEKIKNSEFFGHGAADLTTSSSATSIGNIQPGDVNGGKGLVLGQNFDQTVSEMQKAVTELGIWNDWLLKSKTDQEAFIQSQKDADRAVRVFGSGLESVFTNALSGTQSFVQGMISYLEKLIIKLVAAAAAAEVLNLLTGGSLGFANIFGQLSGLTGGASVGAGAGALSSSGSSAISSPVLSSGLNLSAIKTNNASLSDHQLVATLKGSDLQLALVRSGIQKGRLS